jgi:hypothetical protein
MVAPHADQTIMLNGEVYEIMPGTMQVGPQALIPKVVEGVPGGGEANDDSVVGWDDWQDGGFEVTWANAARFHTAKNVITDIPHQLTLSYLQEVSTGVNEAPTKIAQLRAGDLPVAMSAASVWIQDTGSENWTATLAGVTPTDIIAWGDGTDTLWLVAMGQSTAYRYTDDLYAGPAVWTTSNLGASGDAQYADFWAIAAEGGATSGGTLWKAVKPNKVYATSDPKNTTGAWTSAYFVGGSESEITGMAVLQDRLYVAKTDGLYWINADGTVQPLIDMRSAVDVNNGKALVSWGGATYINWVQGLYQGVNQSLLNLGEVTGSYRDIGPHVHNQESGDIRGRVVAMLGAPTRLYLVMVNTAGEYSISRFNGDTRPGFGWNPGFLWLDDHVCNAMGWVQMTGDNPRLYFGYDATLRYVVLPKFTDNPLPVSSDVKFCPSGTIEMSEYEGAPHRSMIKTMLHMAVDMERLDAATGRHVDVAYVIDDTGSTSGATLHRVEDDGISKLYYSTLAWGRRIKITLGLATGTSANTPRVRMLEHHYEFRPTRRKRWSFQVKASSTRSNPTKTPKKIRDELAALVESTAAIAFEDRYGDTFDVLAEDVTEVEFAKLPGEPQPLETLGVKLREVRPAVGHYTIDSEAARVDYCFVA